MQGSVIPFALRALAKRKRFKPAGELRIYLQENAIGSWDGDYVSLGREARAALEQALLRDFQVPPGTKPEDWSGLSRTEALALTSNEKSTSRRVRASRVAVKAMPRQALRMAGQEFFLPPGASIDTSLEDASNFAQYDKAVLVENWEAFERLHALSFDPGRELSTALAVYRGEPGAYPISAARRFLDALDIPVFVFSDPDPAGLKIAMDFPRFAGLLLPSTAEISRLFQEGRGTKERYTNQLPATFQSLEACCDPRIKPYWELIKRAGRALPQEEFVRE